MLSQILALYPALRHFFDLILVCLSKTFPLSQFFASSERIYPSFYTSSVVVVAYTDWTGPERGFCLLLFFFLQPPKVQRTDACELVPKLGGLSYFISAQSLTRRHFVFFLFFCRGAYSHPDCALFLVTFKDQ